MEAAPARRAAISSGVDSRAMTAMSQMNSRWSAGNAAATTDGSSTSAL
ncbi:hypothetical protein ACFQS3_07155 [Glycomyces mayteni]|uniref:Uncharacterized protein n=1 Tax=Glycomyces mayteni TaxID=543887 RepID=A0ABW2D7N8_9ACTN